MYTRGAQPKLQPERRIARQHRGLPATEMPTQDGTEFRVHRPCRGRVTQPQAPRRIGAEQSAWRTLTARLGERTVLEARDLGDPGMGGIDPRLADQPCIEVAPAVRWRTGGEPLREARLRLALRCSDQRRPQRGIMASPAQEPEIAPSLVRS